MEMPIEYYSTSSADAPCSRFSSNYFEDFHSHVASYCEPDSLASLTCFHRPSGFDGKTDSFCIGQGAFLDVGKGRFQLDCTLRQLSEQERMDGLLPFNELPAYWYETGPSNIFAQAIDIQNSTQKSAGVENEMEDQTASAMNKTSEQGKGVVDSQPKMLLLLKREGEGNPWHCLMEIFSTYLTFDILRMLKPEEGFERNDLLFRHPNDSDDTQIVILDDRDDGPYFDLWTLYARRKPLRLRQLMEDQYLANKLKDIDLIIPLAGSSNPLWKDDLRAQQCTDAPLLNMFSRRVLEFYGIHDPAVREHDAPIVVTFVNRQGTRRLNNERYLFAELQRRNPRASVQMIDFASLPFSEQVRIARGTDVLVGIHGAGLTHSMFMRQGAGAVVEVQPSELDHNGFRNVAGMRGLGYYRAHSRAIPQEEWSEGQEELEFVVEGQEEGHSSSIGNDRPIIETKKEASYESAVTSKSRKRTDWHWLDIDIEEDRFFEVVEAAIKSMYAKGPFNYDIN